MSPSRRNSQRTGHYFCTGGQVDHRKFFDGADVVHFYLLFLLVCKVEVMARKKYLCALAAFHVQAENITYNIGLGKSKVAAKFFYKFLYLGFLPGFADIHCPYAEFIAGNCAGTVTASASMS